MSKPTFISLFVLFAFFLGILSPTAVYSQTPTPVFHHVKLPKPANIIKVYQNQVYLCQGFDGLTVINAPQALIDFEANETPQTATFPQILALDIIPFTEDSFLISTRDSKLLWVKAEQDSVIPSLISLNILHQAPLEGTPVKIEWRNNLLAVASGGAGICLYEFRNDRTEIRLVGRYPFAEFGADVYFLSNTMLAIIDSQLGVATVLDVSDPRNPMRNTQVNLPQMGFMDQLIYNEQMPENLIISSRTGRFISCTVDLENPKIIVPVNEALLPMRNPSAPGVNVNHGLLHHGQTIILERYSGFHLLSGSTALAFQPSYIPLPETRTFTLWNNQLLVSQENGALLFIPAENLLPTINIKN